MRSRSSPSTSDGDSPSDRPTHPTVPAGPRRARAGAAARERRAPAPAAGSHHAPGPTPRPTPRRTSRRSGTCSSSTSRTRATTRPGATGRRRRTSPGRCGAQGCCSTPTTAPRTTRSPTTSPRSPGRGPTSRCSSTARCTPTSSRPAPRRPGQYLGSGCVFPEEVPSLPVQMTPEAPAVEGVHGRHGPVLPAPGAEHPGPDAARDEHQRVRRPAQPVRLLPLDHRPAGVLPAARGRHRPPDRGTCGGRRPRRTCPTSPRTCATTATTRPARTAGRVA